MKGTTFLTLLLGLVILAGCADNGSGTTNNPAGTTGTGTTGTDAPASGTGAGSGTDTGTGAAKGTDAGATTTDKMGFATLGTNIKAALLGNTKTKGMDIKVDVDADTVNLRGTVGSQAEKEEAQKVAQKVMDDHKAGQKLKNELVLGTKGSSSSNSGSKS